MHGISTNRFHSNDLTARSDLFDRVGHAANQATTPYRHDNRVKIVTLFANLKPDRSRACRDFLPFKGMYEKSAFVFLDLFRYVKRLVNIVYRDQLRTVAATGLNTSRICCTDHDDLCTRAHSVRCERRRNSMVTCTDCRDACRSLPVAQTSDDGKCAASLECSCVLQELELAKNPRVPTRKFFKRSAADHRRSHDLGLQPVAQGSDSFN